MYYLGKSQLGNTQTHIPFCGFCSIISRFRSNSEKIHTHRRSMLGVPLICIALLISAGLKHVQFGAVFTSLPTSVYPTALAY